MTCVSRSSPPVRGDGITNASERHARARGGRFMLVVMRLLAGIVLLALSPQLARAQCAPAEETRSRSVLGMRGALSTDGASKREDYELGLRFLNASVSCEAPFMTAVGVEAGSQFTRSGLDGGYVSAPARIVIGHAPPVAFELGVGARYDRAQRLGWFIYASAYLSMYFIEGGGRYEWGIRRANRASVEGLIHVPFDASGPTRF